MKTTPVPVKFDRQGHPCDVGARFGPTCVYKARCAPIELNVMLSLLPGWWSLAAFEGNVGASPCSPKVCFFLFWASYFSGCWRNPKSVRRFATKFSRIVCPQSLPPKFACFFLFWASHFLDVGAHSSLPGCRIIAHHSKMLVMLKMLRRAKPLARMAERTESYPNGCVAPGCVPCQYNT